MRTEITITSHHTIGMVAYGLDLSPTPGYFLSFFDTDDEFISDMDTRPGMSMSGSEPVHRLQIVEQMKKFSEIPEEDIMKVATDQPVGDMS